MARELSDRQVQRGQQRQVHEAVDNEPRVGEVEREVDKRCSDDLLVDPYELENLIGFEAYREVSNELRTCLLRRMVEADEKEPEITLAPMRTSGERWASPEDVNAELS